MGHEQGVRLTLNTFTSTIMAHLLMILRVFVMILHILNQTLQEDGLISCIYELAESNKMRQNAVKYRVRTWLEIRQTFGR